MEKGKQEVNGSSSSFTMDLFCPKESSKSSSSTGLFGSVFGPPSTGLVKESSYGGRNQEFGSQYGNVKHGATDYTNQKSRADSSGIMHKDRNSIYQNETAEPCYFSSSIYYGGQEVYSPTGQTTNNSHQHIFRKDGEDDDDPNGNNSSSASRGNWWQGSLYY